jgi:hypothetical protein
LSIVRLLAVLPGRWVNCYTITRLKLWHLFCAYLLAGVEMSAVLLYALFAP